MKTKLIVKRQSNLVQSDQPTRTEHLRRSPTPILPAQSRHQSAFQSAGTDPGTTRCSLRDSCTRLTYNARLGYLNFTMQCNAITIMGAGVSLYAHINLTNNTEKLLQFTL